MSYYHKLITEATGCPETDAQEVENYMRDIIFHSTLDWQSKALLIKAAQTAWNDIQYMRSPEGIAYMKELEEKYT
jgi:hypothetical protein